MHCTQSYPTAELLEALWSFDIAAFWPLYFSGPFIPISHKISRASQLLDFFSWLKNTVCHPFFRHILVYATHVN